MRSVAVDKEMRKEGSGYEGRWLNLGIERWCVATVVNKAVIQ